MTLGELRERLAAIPDLYDGLLVRDLTDTVVGDIAVSHRLDCVEIQSWPGVGECHCLCGHCVECEHKDRTL